MGLDDPVHRPGGAAVNLGTLPALPPMHPAGQAPGAGRYWNRGRPRARRGSTGTECRGTFGPFFYPPSGSDGRHLGRETVVAKPSVDPRYRPSRRHCRLRHFGHPETRKPCWAGLSVWAPTSDGDGTGGIRGSSPDADIEAATRLRRNTTLSVNTRDASSDERHARPHDSRLDLARAHAAVLGPADDLVHPRAAVAIAAGTHRGNRPGRARRHRQRRALHHR